MSKFEKLEAREKLEAIEANEKQEALKTLDKLDKTWLLDKWQLDNIKNNLDSLSADDYKNIVNEAEMATMADEKILKQAKNDTVNLFNSWEEADMNLWLFC